LIPAVPKRGGRTRRRVRDLPLRQGSYVVQQRRRECGDATARDVLGVHRPDALTRPLDRVRFDRQLSPHHANPLFNIRRRDLQFKRPDHDAIRPVDPMLPTPRDRRYLGGHPALLFASTRRQHTRRRDLVEVLAVGVALTVEPPEQVTRGINDGARQADADADPFDFGGGIVAVSVLLVVTRAVLPRRPAFVGVVPFGAKAHVAPESVVRAVPVHGADTSRVRATVPVDAAPLLTPVDGVGVQHQATLGTRDFDGRGFDAAETPRTHLAPVVPHLNGCHSIPTDTRRPYNISEPKGYKTGGRNVGVEYYPDRWTDLNATQRDICVILAFKGATTGRGISNTRDTGTMTESTTYKNLTALTRNGLVTFEDADPTAAREYRLTTAGAGVVRDAVVETGMDLAGIVDAEVAADD